MAPYRTSRKETGVTVPALVLPKCYLAIILIQGLGTVASLLDVVGAERIANTVALEQGTSNIGKIMGPLGGGILIALGNIVGSG